MTIGTNLCNEMSNLTFKKERESKRSLSQALTAANVSQQEGAQLLSIGGPSHLAGQLQEGDNRPAKAARIQKPKPVTVYVKKADERVYNALCLSKLNLETLQEEIAVKYSIPKNMPVRLYKRTRKGLLIHMDTRMVGQFQDEDDFIVEVSFQNKEGIFEVTFLY